MWRSTHWRSTHVDVIVQLAVGHMAILNRAPEAVGYVVCEEESLEIVVLGVAEATQNVLQADGRVRTGTNRW